MMTTIAGWWYTYSSEKSWSESDDDIPNIWKVIKFTFQTTNQWSTAGFCKLAEWIDTKTGQIAGSHAFFSYLLLKYMRGSCNCYQKHQILGITIAIACYSCTEIGFQSFELRNLCTRSAFWGAYLSDHFRKKNRMSVAINLPTRSFFKALSEN
jgi:hypothetical protein